MRSQWSKLLDTHTRAHTQSKCQYFSGQTEKREKHKQQIGKKWYSK